MMLMSPSPLPTATTTVFHRLAMDHVLVPIPIGQIVHKLNLHDFEASVQVCEKEGDRREITKMRSVRESDLEMRRKVINDPTDCCCCCVPS